VRSVYHLHKEARDAAKGDSSRAGQFRMLWKQIWKIHTSQVVKVSMWRACHNVLPTKANLFCRKVTEDPLCPLCDTEVETIGHILWSCPAAKVTWSMCSRKIQKSFIDHEDFAIIVEVLRPRLERVQWELMAIVPRNLWLRWNAVNR
jgi:hypothetical protein